MDSSSGSLPGLASSVPKDRPFFRRSQSTRTYLQRGCPSRHSLLVPADRQLRCRGTRSGRDLGSTGHRLGAGRDRDSNARLDQSRVGTPTPVSLDTAQTLLTPPETTTAYVYRSVRSVEPSTLPRGSVVDLGPESKDEGRYLRVPDLDHGLS